MLSSVLVSKTSKISTLPLVSSEGYLNLFLIELIFKFDKSSLSKLSLRRDFKTLRKFSFTCFKLLDSFSLKFESETLQHEVLLDNWKLKTFKMCCVKLLLRFLAPFLFEWSLLLFRWLAFIFLQWLMRKKYFCYTCFSNNGWLHFPFHLI